MGGAQAKLSYRSAFVELTNKTQPIDANNDEFWDQFWSDCPTRIRDIFVLVPASEIRALREESPSNLATLCYKAVERLAQIAEASFPTAHDQQTAGDADPEGATSVPLAHTLVSSLCDLLFCPDFTVHSMSKPGPEGPEDMHTIDSCEYIWESGVGFAQTHPPNVQHDSNRTEILRLLLVCFSETMYLDQSQARTTTNRWIDFFTGPDNRHVLPLFTSLLNIVCAYNPVASSLPYNHLVFTDSREPLVEVSLQVLCVALETDLRALEVRTGNGDSGRRRLQSGETTTLEESSVNLFVNYMSRIHRDEDFSFILTGLARLLNNPLTQTYLPGSAKKVQMHQELLILFWRMCDINRKFMFYVLKSSRVLEILVPILYYLNEARSDKCSGERNFGVRLNKPYTNRVPMDVTVFTGNHADLLVIVFHKIITTGHAGLQPLFDCLITIIDNVSPYVKSLSMVSANKLVHLTEAFSQPWFLFSAPNNYQLVLFLLEVFNNIIQYQFDGNSCLIYTIIRKRHVFYNLANLPRTDTEIREILAKHGGNRRFDYGDDTDATETATTAATAPAVPETAKQNAHADPEVEHPAENPEATPKSTEASHNGTQEPLTTTDGEQSGSAHPDAATENEASKQTLDPAQPGAGAFQASLLGTPDLSSMTDHQLADQRGAKPETLEPPHPEGDSFEDLHSHETPTSPSVEPSTTDSKSHRGEDEETVAATDKAAHQPSPSAKTTPLSTKLNLSFGTATDPASSKSAAASQPSMTSTPQQLTSSTNSDLRSESPPDRAPESVRRGGAGNDTRWRPTSRWVADWQSKLPLQTVMRLLQVLVPQVEKICIEKGLTDESEVLKFLQNGTLVGLLPVPHPILIRKYQSNFGTAVWFRTYIWGVIYLRNLDPPIWYDTNVRLFEVQPI
nr:unnamed protein product [Spirometra erinaceieuropaei]